MTDFDGDPPSAPNPELASEPDLPERSSAQPGPESEIARLTAEIAGLRADLRAARASLDQSRASRSAALADMAVSAESARAPRRSRSDGLLARALAPAKAKREELRPAVVTARTWPARLRAEIARGRTRREWSPPKPLLCAAVALVAITILAYGLRAVDLRGIPEGMHGDEAATGLEARRIIKTHWIGVYSGIAGGNPTGIYYLATIPISLISDPVVAVRILSAIIGTLAVAALFVLAYRNAGFGSAVIAGLLLAVAEWHIQFSRIGFVTGDWPTFVLLGVIALAEGIRGNRWYWWIAAGFFISAATYVYNGNGPVLLIVAAFVLWTLFGWRALFIAASVALAIQEPFLVSVAPLLVSLGLCTNRRFRNRTAWINVVCYAGSSLLTLRGLINFVRAHRQDYFGRGHELSVFKTDAWKAQQSKLDRAHFLLDRYKQFWDRLTFHPNVNGADLSGVTPLVPEVTFWIVAIGMVVVLIRRPTPLVLLSTAIVLAIPITPVLTDLTMRRALVILPFLALLGAMGMVELVQLAFGRGRKAGVMATAALTVALVFSSYRNYTDFFDKTVDSGPIRATFPLELRRSSDYIHTLPSDAYVYLYSDRWGLHYDVVALIDPDVKGEDRLPQWGGDGSYEIDWSKGRPVFLLVGAQAANLDKIRALYPNGTVVTGPYQPAPLDGPAYVAYLPDPS